MEEAATIEKREDQPKSTEDKNKQDKEEKDSQGKDEETPGAQIEQDEPSESVVNSIGNSDTVNQAGDQTVNNTVKYVETNQGAIDQENEQCGPINANRNTSQGAGNVTLNVDNEPQMEEGAVGAHTNVTLKQNEQPDKEGDVENVVLPEEVECDSPAEVSAQVVDKESQPDVIKNETPEGEKRWSSQETTKGERTKGLPLAVSADEKSPKEDFEKTEAASSEVTIPAAPSPFDKEPSKERENGNTTTTEKESLDHPEQQKNEEEGPVSPEPSEIVKTAPAVTSEVDEQQQQQQQPGDQDEETVGETEKDIPPKGSQSWTTWYSGGKQAPQQEAEGYSTSVVAGVVMRKPLSSTSNESKTPTRGSSTGSVFKKMSWGSLFGRRRSTKDKPNMAQQAATETPVHDGTDGVQENSPGHLDPKEDSTPVDATVKDISQDAGEPSEAAVVTSKPQGNEEELPSAQVEEEKDIAEGAIVPLEEGVTETLEQDEHNDDIDTPDEDSLLRERIAKRESGTPSHSPTKHMQMRMSYAEGTKEVEVIGTLEAPVQHKQDKQKTAKDNRVSCRELGEVDHEGWLAKRGGGAIFASWKRKWVVLKEQHVYYYKTSFDPEAGGVIDVKDHTITAVPEMKKKFCFKIESKDPKATKLYFAADSHEKMNRWISVLTSASRGEIIVCSTQNQESSDVRMRKKTNSMGKRAGSVLGLGGYYSYDGQLEKTDQKRRASFGSSPKEAPKNIQPGENPENNDHSESSTENATPNDIQKLLITETKGDSVDAAVAMETSAPLKEVEATVVLAVNSEEQKQAPVEGESKISSETTKEECLHQATSPDPEKTVTVPKVCQSETKDSSALPKDTHVATPPEKHLKPSHPTGPSNTTWYYVLDDDHDNWIDLDELKDEASKRDSDELLSLVRTIKDARLSMIGTPLPGNEERVRAITNVSKQNEEVLKLREMKRTLKDKQRDLMAMEELLTKDVNRQSIHEWKTRYSYLTPEEDPIEEGESKENGSDEKENESRSLGMPDGKECDGGVKDTSVGEEKVGDSADEQEIKLEECGHQENRKNMSEHEEVSSDKEVQDKLEEVEVKEDGELQNDGGESPKNGKLEDSGDEPTHAKDDANDVMLVQGDTHQKMEAIKHDVDGDSVDQTVQEETTEQNNNGDMNTCNLLNQQGKQSGNNDKEGKKSINTPQTLTLQDQDSIDTRL